MPKESLPVVQDILDIKTLSPQTKMRMVLEIFDLGKDMDKNEKRKDDFLNLIRQYNSLAKQKNKKTKELIFGSDTERTKIHDQIMDIFIKMCLSVGLPEEQKRLVEYLANNRDEVELMIGNYFLGYNPSNPREYSDYQMAHKGESWFRSIPGKEDE